MSGARRFFSGFPWRGILTTLAGETVTSLERLAANRTFGYGLNQPAVTSAQVPSNDPRVNITDVESGPDHPHLSYSDRLFYAFRREAVNPAVWVCRFGGIVMQIEDTARADQPYSMFTAYDPWQYLFSRIMYDGTSPISAEGLSYNEAGNLIVADILANALLDGEMFITWDPAGFDTTDVIDITFQQGTSVGAALQQLVALGGMDIEFRPLYDTSFPGVCCELFVHAQMGSVQNGAPFSWGVGRSIGGISRLLDGSQLANDIRFHNGQGGPLVTPATDATSQTRYGVYSAEQFFPAQTKTAAVEAMAQFQLALRKDGRRTVTLNPDPLLSPKPFLDYGLGDRVPVYATSSLRQAIPTPPATVEYQRVFGIPIRLGDDGVETVDHLLTSPDGF